MASFLALAISAVILLVSQALAQTAYGTGCGAALEDIPNPASDSCTAFFRCYKARQYSLRCPLGQAFDFDRARCRPASEVDCPLQLQRFQAPAVPSYLRPPGTQQQEREIEIRVVQVPAGIDPNTLQIAGNGRLTPVSRQFAPQQGQSILHTPARTGYPQQNNPAQGHVQGQFVQGSQQVGQGQFFQPQPQPQPQPQAQPAPAIPGQTQPAAPAQGQDALSILVPYQGQPQPGQ